MSKIPLLLFTLLSLAAVVFLVSKFKNNAELDNRPILKAGDVVTTHRKVPVYSNGKDFTQSHGKHYSKQGYYYGQKWQCVEFVKRFYHDAFNHQMPSVWGHAKDFYNVDIAHGALNQDRGMLQFENGGNMKPRPDDLLVFNSAPFGHVAVISAVRNHEIEVVQQNIAGQPRQIHPLSEQNGSFVIGTKRKPVGWLRLPEN